MFEDILKAVKEHFNNNPELAAAIPDQHAEAVHHEIATQIHENIQNSNAAAGNSAIADPNFAAATEEPQSSGLGSMASNFLSSIEQSLSSGGIGTSVISGGLVGALASKFGLPSAVTGAIAAAVPGLLQKLAARNQQPTA